MTSTHGLDQSLALDTAAVELSEAKINYARAKEAYGVGSVEVDEAFNVLASKQAAYNVAYNAYTHKGKVVKTVDVRWPDERVRASFNRVLERDAEALDKLAGE
jgi:hypothetical protein